MSKFIPRTNRQNSAFHKLIGARGYTESDKEQLVLECTNGREQSSKKMSFTEMNAAISKLGGTPFISRQKRQTTYYGNNVVGMVSPQAIRKIESLRYQLPQYSSAESWRRFLQHTIKKSAVRTVSDGQDVIEALKAILGRKTPRAQEAA